MTRLESFASRAAARGQWQGSLPRAAGALVACLCMWVAWAAFSADPADAACSPHQCFLQRVIGHQPVLHVDLTDGFRPQNLRLVFNYRALSSTFQPQFTCLRYNSDQSNDDHPCTSQFRGAGPAAVANVGPGSNVDHLDYPARPTGDCGKKARGTSGFCPEEALANHYWNGQPVIYFFGARDNRNQKHYEYWFFYGFNYFVATQNLIVTKIHKEIDLHEGDFEHVIVYTDARDRPLAYTFYQHSGHTNYAANDPRLDTKDGHVRVYAGHGSHASEIGCGLWDNNVAAGQRDRTCVRDPYTDNVINPSVTATYAPRNTAISNLDTANWACFGDRDPTPGRQHRLGQSHDDIGGGTAPQAPLIQSHACPNRYERTHPAASATADELTPGAALADAEAFGSPTVPVPTMGSGPADIDAAADVDSVEADTSDAFAGIDKCSDWDTPTQTSGVQVVVCNQSVLTRWLDAASLDDIATVEPRSISGPSIITGRAEPTASSGAPAYVSEPDANALKSDVIVDNGSPSDVYISSAQDTPDGPVRWEALFRGVSSSTGALHVDATSSNWSLVDGSGHVIATATPIQVQ